MDVRGEEVRRDRHREGRGSLGEAWHMDAVGSWDHGALVPRAVHVHRKWPADPVGDRSGDLHVVAAWRLVDASAGRRYGPGRRLVPERKRG